MNMLNSLQTKHAGTQPSLAVAIVFLLYMDMYICIFLCLEKKNIIFDIFKLNSSNTMNVRSKSFLKTISHKI